MPDKEKIDLPDKQRREERKARADKRQITIELLFQRLKIWMGIGVGTLETKEQAAVREILQSKIGTEEQRKEKAEALSFEHTKAMLHEIYEEDLEQKLETLGHEDNQEMFLKDAVEAANEWWITAENKPDEVINKTGTKGAARQFTLDEDEKAEHSVELFQQLYYDAAKAQLRLQQIASTVGIKKDLPASISAISVSMPDIKGTVRATYKSWLPDHVKFIAIEQIPEEERTQAQNEEFKVLKETLFGKDDTNPDQPFSAGLRDLSRGTIEVPKLTEIVPSVYHFFEKLKVGCKGAEVTRFKNKFNSDELLTSGYADIQVHFRIDAGHICEMQFNCKALMDFKSFGGSRRNSKMDGESDNPAANWATLIKKYLGEKELHFLDDAAKALEELNWMEMINGEPDEKTVEAIKKIKDGFHSGKWPLNAHLIYDITRWLEKAPVKKQDYKVIKDNVIEKLKSLSLKGSEAFQKSIADTEGNGEQSFADLLQSVADFDLPLGE